MKENRVVIAVPSGDMWDARFAMSMVFMTAHISANHVINKLPTMFRIHNKTGSILCAMRQKLVEQALKGEATHLLFIDSDQTFPSDLLHGLMARQKSVVACNIATKAFPSCSTARKYGSDGKLVPVHTTEGSEGLERVDRVGAGIMLIDLRILKRSAMKVRPWFTMEWNEGLQDYTGEDWFFCKRLEEAEIPIYIDHDVSKEIGHMGKLEYTIEMVSSDSVSEVA